MSDIDKELETMRVIGIYFKELDENEIRRILNWATDKFVNHATSKAQTENTISETSKTDGTPSVDSGSQDQSQEYRSLDANAKADAEKLMEAAFWQMNQGGEEENPDEFHQPNSC